jgi:hypothetical protein
MDDLAARSALDISDERNPRPMAKEGHLHVPRRLSAPAWHLT